ncbi:MAG: hypothetical protein JST10_06180 [Bacteroidetes bacterium]|nr:hypothetical protein [Bacteroidota bacterium]
MKLYQFFILPFLSMTCFAQVSRLPDAKQKAFDTDKAKICGGWDSIFSKKGKWKKSKDDLAFTDKTFPAGQYKYVNTRIDSIAAFLQETIEDLSGVEARWYRGTTGNAYIPGGPVPYSLNCGFFSYYCNTNSKKILLSEETGQWIYVFVNTLNWFLDKGGEWDINNDGKLKTFFQLPPVNDTWKDYRVYEPKYFLGGCHQIYLQNCNHRPQ